MADTMDKKDVAIVSLTILSAISLLLVFVFNGLSATGQAFFENSVVNVSDTYMTDITPAGYTFAIWGIIYAWSTAWMLYAVIGICRKNNYGPVLLNPVVLTIPVQIFWIISCIANIVWLVLWCKSDLFVAFILISILTLSGFATIGFVSASIQKNQETIRKHSKIDYALVYALYQNGITVYFTWTTVATMINLSVFLTYDPIVEPNMSSRDASIIALSILLAGVVIWSVLENSVLFRYVRFLYSWYFVIVWAAAGVLVENYDIENPNTILTIVLICVTVVCLAIKIAVYFYRTKSATVAIDMELRSEKL